MNHNIEKMSKFRQIMHESVYLNYDNVIQLATAICEYTGCLNYQNYNMVNKTITFRIKKTVIKKTKYSNLPESYYAAFSIVFQNMINVWRPQITQYIFNKYGNITSPYYLNDLELLNYVSTTETTYPMLLFNVTSTLENGIVLHL